MEKRTDIRWPEVDTYGIGVLGSQAFATSLSCCYVFEYDCVAPVLRTLPAHRAVGGLGSRLVDIFDRDTCSMNRRVRRAGDVERKSDVSRAALSAHLKTSLCGFARASLRLRAGTQARMELKRRSENHSGVRSIVACSPSTFTLCSSPLGPWPIGVGLRSSQRCPILLANLRSLSECPLPMARHGN